MAESRWVLAGLSAKSRSGIDQATPAAHADRPPVQGRPSGYAAINAAISEKAPVAQTNRSKFPAKNVPGIRIEACSAPSKTAKQRAAPLRLDDRLNRHQRRADTRRLSPAAHWIIVLCGRHC